jgi:subtilase family serine protease
MRFVPLTWALLLGLLFAAPASAESQKPVCPGPTHHGMARCHAHVVTDDQGKPLGKPQPSQAALTPVDLRSAYGLTSLSASNGGGRTIAIVDAYHYPTAEHDLGVYRDQYGLPACTVANGCFKQVNQLGQSSNYPAIDAGWAQEEALDIDMASAICPNCKIVLVEANSAYMTDLGASENTAAGLADVISNSYGGGEYSSESADESAFFNHPGKAITVSSGDSGYGVEFPAASQYVTAVGGTSLKRTTTAVRGWTETAWSGAGSGCSAVVARPAWQPVKSGCSNRMVADVSAVADPATGVAVYDSTPYQNASGWLKFGGTSVAAPLVAGVYALGSFSGYPSSIAYSAPAGSLFDVISGSNGRCRTATYLCTAGTGYDGPTGLGTPNGIAAF